MLLLPGAERERRALLLGAALAAGLGLSWWPLAGLDAWIARQSSPVAGPIAAVAGWLSGLILPAPPAAPAAAPPVRLADLERAAATPPEVRGLAWLEVPVLHAKADGTELLLAAGSRHSLAPGMPVVWGSYYLGRIARVSETEALVLRPAAADERTGVGWNSEDGSPLEAVAIGRGGGLAPVLHWLAEGPEPVPGLAVRFRGRRNDPPALAEAGFLLGHLAPRGSASRGDAAWVIEEARPEAAEGRVFVAAGALPADPIQMPALLGAPSRSRLGQDAVLGPRLSAWAAPARFEPSVLVRGERVLGPVVARRGGLAWVRADRPEHWAARAVVMLESPPRLLLATDLPPGARGLWFTRGSDGVPRGLWLGRSGAEPPQSGAAMLLRAPGWRGDFP